MNKSLFLMGVLVVVLLVGGCVQTTTPEEKTTFPESLEKFFESVNISFNATPLLNQPVELTIAASPLYDVSNATLEILLPEGFELVSGDLKWEGNLRRNETILLKAIIKSIKTGDWAIQFLAVANPPERGFIALETKFSYVSVSETASIVNDTPSPGIEYKVSIQKSMKTTTEKDN